MNLVGMAAGLILQISSEAPPVVEYQLPSETTVHEFACGPSRGRLALKTERVGPPVVSDLRFRAHVATAAEVALLNDGLKSYTRFMGADVLCLGLDPSAATSIILVFRGYDRFMKPLASSYELSPASLRPSTFSLHQFPPFTPKS